MPEGPELHMAARFINKVAKNHKFGGKIVKSEVSTKNPDVTFSAKSYSISAETRGKELKVFLQDKDDSSKKTRILFRFGMSGCFKFTTLGDLPKHAHLRFFTLGEQPPLVLSFVDYRRFGRWEIDGDWGKDRGPDPIFDYQNFRRNVLENLKKAAFNHPICEVLLNQQYFNGIGNYLRAEILFRAGIEPFTQAREVLQPLLNDFKSFEPDLLELCNIVPKEVLNLDKGKNYDPDTEGSEASFTAWLQCYYVPGMKNLKDNKGRTIWFHGEPGPMAPKNAKEVGRKGGTGSKVPKSGSDNIIIIEDDSDSKENQEIPVKKESEENCKVEPKDEKPSISKNKKKVLKRDSEEESKSVNSKRSKRTNSSKKA